jgi:hypothetical protein
MNTEIDLHLPEYDHVFSDGAKQCCPTLEIKDFHEFRQITVSPSGEHPGFWHYARYVDGLLETSKRPMRATFFGYFLRSWGYPRNESAWRDCNDMPELEKPAANGDYPEIVYFLSAGPFIKIGFTSKHPKGRVDELKTGCPYPITVLGVIEGSQKTERELHRKFSASRANLEWFHESPGLLGFIKKHAREA